MKEQIEEMSGVVGQAINHNCWLSDERMEEIDMKGVAEELYNAGYRKQSEGEWHYNPDGMDRGLGAWECSSCGCRNNNLPMDKNINPLRWAGSKYCPNCGAKMKGGAE